MAAPGARRRLFRDVVLVRGPPGSGKSALLKKIAVLCLRQT